jgi:hypothetical protein
MNKRKRKKKQFFHCLGRFSRTSAQETFNRTAQLLRALLTSGPAASSTVHHLGCPGHSCAGPARQMSLPPRALTRPLSVGPVQMGRPPPNDSTRIPRAARNKPGIPRYPGPPPSRTPVPAINSWPPLTPVESQA